MSVFNKSIISILFILSFLSAGDKIAVTTKVMGLVEIGRNTPVEYSKIKPGTLIEDGDRIRTGNDGFVTLIFIDDKSILKIKKNTDLEVTGKKMTAQISKQINMDNGTIRAQIEQQNKTKFIIRTPTSVASVKGTDFWLISDPYKGDQLMGLEGTVNLFNIFTGISMDVTAGFTGNSTVDGVLNIAETNESNIPIDPDDTDIQSGSELKIYLDKPEGTQKIIVIQYE